MSTKQIMTKKLVSNIQSKIFEMRKQKQELEYERKKLEIRNNDSSLKIIDNFELARKKRRSLNIKQKYLGQRLTNNIISPSSLTNYMNAKRRQINFMELESKINNLFNENNKLINDQNKKFSTIVNIVPRLNNKLSSNYGRQLLRAGSKNFEVGGSGKFWGRNNVGEKTLVFESLNEEDNNPTTSKIEPVEPFINQQSEIHKFLDDNTMMSFDEIINDIEEKVDKENTEKLEGKNSENNKKNCSGFKGNTIENKVKLLEDIKVINEKLKKIQKENIRENDDDFVSSLTELYKTLNNLLT